MGKKMKEIIESTLKQFTTEQLEELIKEAIKNNDIKLAKEYRYQLYLNAAGDFAFSAESSTDWMYESNKYDSNQLVPDQVTPASDELLIVNGTASAGISTSYSRRDHVHPQQLTYDNDITATKFIKTGGTNQQILLANRDTTTLDSKLSRTYNGSAGVWIRLCVFPASASVGNPFIEFKVHTAFNAVQTIRLVPYYTVNRINSIYGVFTAPTKVSTNYNIVNGVNQLFHVHSGSGTSAIYAAYVRLQSAGTITIVVSDQSTYYTYRITEILTQDVVSGVPNGTQIPITYDLANGGIINNMLQVKTADRSYISYNNGIRIGNYNTEYSSLYLGYSNSAINTTQLCQWEISKTSDRALTINPSSLHQADHSVGLSINSDSSIIKFNGNGLVDVVQNYVLNTGTPTTFAGVTSGNIQIYPTATSYEDGLRISRSDLDTGNATIQLGCSRTSNTGAIVGQWSTFTPLSRSAINPLGLTISLAADQSDINRGLQISADGNTLTFNGQVIAGTGSVNYSQGNLILWGVNSL
ncbi:MAG: hypothetical protein EZS28_006597 [Streblomastix strix]|uniref:Uncharacterized protein n=1 Tax=Streblomastix strix TaxID=222440 RepID=A0A5J4WU03_9EUKA|nr:MAG: hypothetical protein EZS28_006597 [Streblomastix strix]